jgi:hypothetical protein
MILARVLQRSINKRPSQKKEIIGEVGFLP